MMYEEIQCVFPPREMLGRICKCDEKLLLDGNADDRDARFRFARSAQGDAEIVLNSKPGQLAIACSITLVSRFFFEAYGISKIEISARQISLSMRAGFRAV